MSEQEYLNLVKVYLSQELPEIFKSSFVVADGYIKLTLPDDVVFDKGYAKLKTLIEESVERIRQKEFDLNFTIWSASKAQSRDFRLYRSA